MPSAVFCRDFRASRYCGLDISSGSLSCILLRDILAVALAGMALRALLPDNSSTADFSASVSQIDRLTQVTMINLDVISRILHHYDIHTYISYRTVPASQTFTLYGSILQHDSNREYHTLSQTASHKSLNFIRIK